VKDLFGEDIKTNNAIKHDRLRHKQAINADTHHHPYEKIKQLQKLDISGEILEVFAGQGNLTEFYKDKGTVTSLTKEVTGDSFKYVYNLVADRKSFDVIDIDGYGYPSAFMDVVWKLMKPECLFIMTYPVIGVQCVNGIYEQHYITNWRSSRPTLGDVVGATTDYGLRHWYLPKVVDIVKIKPIWRIAFKCVRVKATEFTSTRNR